MIQEITTEKISSYLNKLCIEIPERSVGSPGNKAATDFFEKEISSMGWETESREFDAMDWNSNGAFIKAEGLTLEALPSPYALGCSVEGELAAVSTVEELEKADAKGKIILLHGEITREQLMPKNFVFYNPDEHKKIISLLEQSGAAAIITATGRNSGLAGGAYPFPMIEDGDFNIPSVYMKDIQGEKLLPFSGKKITLHSDAKRIEAKGYNIIARKGENSSRRIVITAHIDAKKGTPGAIDNATGVIVLLLLAELLKDYSGKNQIEIVAFNGEDYYAVPGQMEYIKTNMNNFGNILLNINIDGAGYFEGDSAYSFYDLPEELKEKSLSAFTGFTGLREGVQWIQGDHSIFVQFGVPAIAITSNWFSENMETQDVTHTEKDHPGIVDVTKLQTIAEAINKLIILNG